MDIDKMTERLFEIPFNPSDRPDPMETSLTDLEPRIHAVIDELWHNRNEWKIRVSELNPIWPASLRVTAMYLNMCDAFHGCGRDFMVEASGNESDFVEKYQECESRNRRDRASRLLARTTALHHILGFKSRVIAIGGDALYNRMCEESSALLLALKRA